MCFTGCATGTEPFPPVCPDVLFCPHETEPLSISQTVVVEGRRRHLLSSYIHFPARSAVISGLCVRTAPSPCMVTFRRELTTVV